MLVPFSFRIRDSIESMAALAAVSYDAALAVRDLMFVLLPPEKYAVAFCGVAESDVKRRLIKDGDHIVQLKNWRKINVTRDHGYPRAA